MSSDKPKISDWLDKKGVKHRYFKFSKEVYTVEESIGETEMTVNQVIKSMFLVDKEDNFIMVCLPGSKKVDTRKVKEGASLESRPSFASPEQVLKNFDQKVGACSALSAIGKLPIYFDEAIKDVEECSLSAGELLFEIILKTKDLIDLINPKFGDFSK